MASSRWSLRNIYLYLVCLITLIMVIVSVVGIVRDTVKLVYPEVGYYYETPVDKGGNSGLTQEEIDRQRQLDAERAKQQAIYSLVGNAAMLLVAGPLYVYHWRKIEVEHVDRTETPATGV
jgi:hypothetical protein